MAGGNQQTMQPAGINDGEQKISGESLASDEDSLEEGKTPPKASQPLGSGLESKRQSAATCNTK